MDDNTIDLYLDRHVQDVELEKGQGHVEKKILLLVQDFNCIIREDQKNKKNQCHASSDNLVLAHAV
jgi:hypothetical protein